MDLVAMYMYVRVQYGGELKLSHSNIVLNELMKSYGSIDASDFVKKFLYRSCSIVDFFLFIFSVNVDECLFCTVLHSE